MSVRIEIPPTSDGYELFLKCKRLPSYHVEGRTVVTDERSYRVVFGGVSDMDGAAAAGEFGHLFDYQRHVVATALEMRRYAAFLECGMGKGLPNDWPVLTPSGWTAIGSLSVGDEVIGGNGRACRVTGVFIRGELPSNRVTFTDGTSVVCDDDHLWRVQSHNDQHRGKPFSVKSTAEIRDGGWTYGRGGFRNKYRIPMTPPVDFGRRDALAIDPYVLGVVLGDGCIVSVTPRVSCPDQFIRDEVSRRLADGDAATEVRSSGGKCGEFSITGAGRAPSSVSIELQELGLIGKTSDLKFVPNEYLFASASDRLDLLRGLMDTDGYSGGVPEFSSSSERLARAVVFLVQSLGGTARIKHRVNCWYTVDGVRNPAKPSWRVTVTMPDGVNPFLLPRKADAWSNVTRGRDRRICNVEREGTINSVCISVDSPDSCFITNDFIVTHNTSISLAYANTIAQRYGRVLYLCPLAVMEDTQRHADKYFGGRMSNLRNEPWRTDVAIMNWESMRTPDEKFAGIVIDESSVLKNGDGKIRKWLTELAQRCEFRLALTATPSPNEQAEYGTHAVALGYSKTLNEFYSQYFIKDEKIRSWRLKGHAVDPFYDFLSSWACYIHSPSALGFSDTMAELPNEPNYRIINTSAPDYSDTGSLFTTSVSLSQFQRLAGKMRSDTTQPRFRDACDAVANSDRCIVWCIRNAEEQAFHRELGGHLITGTTPIEERVEMIDDFRAGRVKFLISKPKIMGFGVNIPEATDMLYSGYDFSFESQYQAVRRAHRFGRVGTLNVHVPVTDMEQPVWSTIQRKQKTFDDDVRMLQSRLARGIRR